MAALGIQAQHLSTPRQWLWCNVRKVSTSWASATTGLVGGVIFPSDMMAVFFGYRERVFV